VVVGQTFPRGMLYALVTGLALFATFSAVVSASVYKLSDLDSVRGLVAWACPSKYVIVTGMMACCLGTALLHLTAARTTLRGMVSRPRSIGLACCTLAC
jgi:hypothetical protein